MKRFVADLELAKCVAGNLIERGCPAFFAFVLGTAMFLGVRIGGMPIFPAKKFRWGYGWKYTKSVTYKQQEKLSP